MHNIISDEEYYLNSNEEVNELEDEWGFDDEDIMLEEEVMLPKQVESMVHEIQQYMNFLSFPNTIDYVNTVCFSKEKCEMAAKDLQKYYLQRPQLFAYTFNTELHRMEYTVIEDYSTVVSKINEIRRRYSEKENLSIFRAANQSLLADAIQCLSTKDIIRSQFLAIAVADKCHFLIDLQNRLIQCQCHLILSLPLDNQRLEIANLELEIWFAMDVPELKMKLVHLTPNQVSNEKIIKVATLLEEQKEMMQETIPYHNTSTSIRDALTMSTTQAATGMSSTLRQMETVVNVKEKLSFFRNLLPSADLIAAVEQEETHNNGIRLYDREEVNETPNSTYDDVKKEGWSDDELDFNDDFHEDYQDTCDILNKILLKDLVSRNKSHHTNLFVVKNDTDVIPTRKRWVRPSSALIR